MIVFDKVIADMSSNKKPIDIELFLEGRKLDISLVFIVQSYFAVPKNIIILPIILRISNKRELQQITINHSLEIKFLNLWTLIKNVQWNHVFS